MYKSSFYHVFFHLNPHVTVVILILACFSCLILAESFAPERQVYATKDPRRSRSHLRRMARNCGHDLIGPRNVWCFIWDSFTLSKSKVATAGKSPVWLTTINGKSPPKKIEQMEQSGGKHHRRAGFFLVCLFGDYQNRSTPAQNH